MTARSALTRVLFVLGLFTAGIIAFNFVVMPALVHQRDAVIVPDLRNTSAARAAETLARLGLQMRVDRSEHDTQVPAGFIVSQSPRMNETLKSGRTVVVVTSLGPAARAVPELAGMTLRQSRALIARAGLALGRVARVTRTGVEKESVIATRPSAGDEALDGEPVDLVIEVPGGGPWLLMPDLTSQDLFVARGLLEKRGFRVGTVRYEAREGMFPNTIVEQRPRAGARIRAGESVELVASSTR